MKPKNTPLQSFTYFLISLSLGCYLLQVADFIFVPLAWSLFLSVSLAPASEWLEHKHFPRGLATLMVISLVTLLALVILYFFVFQVMGLMEIGPVMEVKIQDYLKEIQRVVLENFGINLGIENIRFEISRLFNGSSISRFIQSTAEMILMLGIMPVYIFFFIYYRDFFKEFLRKQANQTNDYPLKWASDAGMMVQNYLKGMFIVTLIVACMAAVVFYLLGVKYFLFFALFVAVFNLIPYIGVVLSSAVSVLYLFLTTDSLWYPLITLLLLWIIQLIENNLITPVVVGSKIKLNPLAVIIAIMAGGWIWGVSGIILFIPLVGVLKIIFDQIDYLSPYGYLLGTDIPVVERNENFLKLLKRRLGH